MIINKFQRYENKYLIKQDVYKKLIDSLKKFMRYDEYCLDGKVYPIYNIYLDNDNNDIIRNSIETSNYKEKMRIRCYDISVSNKTYFLELKRKCNGIVNKRRVTLSKKELIDFIDNKVLPIRDNICDKQILKEFVYYLNVNDVKPKIFISYDRIALISNDSNRIRITIDNNIITRTHNLYFENDKTGDKLISDEMYLMEIKVEGSIPLWLVKILSENKIYKQGFSKYGTDYKKRIRRELC